MAVIVAVAVNSDGRREILGITVMPSEAETFWADFLRSLTRRGLRGVQMVISDAHEGLKAAASKVLGAGWQRCRVGPLKNCAENGPLRPTLPWPVPFLERQAGFRHSRSSAPSNGPIQLQSTECVRAPSRAQPPAS